MDLDNLKERIKQKFVYKLKDDTSIKEIADKLGFESPRVLFGEHHIVKSLDDDYLPLNIALNCETKEVTFYWEGDNYDYLVDPTVVPKILTLIESGYFHKVPLPLPEVTLKDYKEAVKALEDLKSIFEKRKTKEVK